MSDKKGHDIDFLRGNVDTIKPKKNRNLDDSYTFSDFKFDRKKVSDPDPIENKNARRKSLEEQIKDEQFRKMQQQNPPKSLDQQILEDEIRMKQQQSKANSAFEGQYNSQQMPQQSNLSLEEQIREDELRLQQKRKTLSEQLQGHEIVEEHFEYGYSSDPKIASGERKPLKPQSNNNFNRGGNGGNGNKMMNNKMKRPKKKKGKAILTLVAILLFLGVAFVGSLFAFKTFSGPVYFTIIGVDQRAGQDDKEIRADALMSVGASSKDNKILMASIPRDTLTYIPCEKQKDKITHAYVYGATNWDEKTGGVKCTTASASQLVGVNSEKYAKINFDNMVDMINAIGGIDLKATATFSEQDSKGKKNSYHFKKGQKYHMDGEQALAYSRHRKSDNDIERGLRQQQVFKAIFRRAKEAKVWEWPGIYTKVSRMVETNLSQKEKLQVAMIYATGGTNEAHKFDWEGGWYGNMSIVELSPTSVEQFTQKLKSLN